MDNKVSKVDIGFVENCEKWKLSSRFFPSKVGGKPAWLNLDNIPGKEDIECEYCKDPCIFLCQVYAPYEDDPKAFHRTIFIFICKNSECCKLNKNGNLKALRSQLEKNNKFYPSEPPIESQEWRPDISNWIFHFHISHKIRYKDTFLSVSIQYIHLVAESWIKSCQVCGLRAPSHCSKCKKVYYCCRQHQVYDWKHGHKNCCAIGINLEENSFLLPEFEIITEADEYSDEFSDSDNEDDDDKKNIEEYEKLVINNEAGSLQNEKNIDSDLLKMSATVDDETFFEFTNKVKKYPDQILR